MNDPARKIQSCLVCKCLLAAALMTLFGACRTLAPPSAPPKAVSISKPDTPLPPPAPPPAIIAEPAPAAAEAPAPPPVAVPAEPVDSAPGVLTRTDWSELPGWTQDNHTEALPALLASCKVLAKQPAWNGLCDAAPAVNGREAARAFFELHFTPYRVAGTDGKAEGFITGYYEPTLRGSRKPSARNRYPLYGAPDDLLSLELGELAPELKSTAPRVRLDGKRVVPYYTRAQIDHENSPLRGKEVAWVEDPVELFFLQVQGSGRIALEEGGVMRVGFAAHNGHPYRSIGRVLMERRELNVDQASMQGIKAWARANPGKLTELLHQNPRYVFFRELPPAAGTSASADANVSPPGSLGVPLTPLRSIAVDARYVPLGVPVHIATTWPNSSKPLQRLMLAQDTGGAIRGAVRADFFWGAGEMAAREAGRMQQQLRMWVLLPNAMSVPPVTP
jgi:membrane-bound lytic murein transglycosylase A